LDYTSSEMTSMSIKLFNGPQSDPLALTCAVKAVIAASDAVEVTIPLLLVYSRCGEARPACVRCSAIRGCDGTAEACCLLFGWDDAGAAENISSSDAPPHDDDGGQAAAAPSRVGTGGLARLMSRPVRSQMRGLHNFMVGLEIQRESQRAAAAFCAAP
jgi:hypothetical protein